MKVKVNIYLKEGILDPQGKAVHHALDALGFESVKDIRIGKQVIIELGSKDEKEAIEEATKMAQKLLANPVTEDFDIEAIKQ